MFVILTFKPQKLMDFFDFMTEDIAIDLGTANTLIIHNDKVVIDSPSIVAL
jgi:rod shape-determining protein MreB